MRSDLEVQETKETIVSRPTSKKRLPRPLDAVVVVVMGILLYCGASWQIFNTNTDAARYQCYASTFLYGMAAIRSYPASQCGFILRTSGQTSTNAQIAEI